MAEFTLKYTAFPDGVTVGAYLAEGFDAPPPPGNPPGTAVATAEANARTVKFTGLEFGTAYFAMAEVGGKWVYRRFITAPVSEPLAWESAVEERSISVRADAFGAKGDGETDDSKAIQAAIDAASAKGGGVVFLPVGTYIIGTTLILKSNVILQGAGPAASVLKLKAGANTDVLKVESYESGGQDSYQIRSLSINGNKANNTSGTGFKSDGRRVILDDFWIYECKGDGLVHKRTANPTADGGEETLISNFRIWKCDGNGFVQSSSDTQIHSGFCIQNSKANLETTTTTVITDVHCWQLAEYAFKLNGSTFLKGCTAEGASKAQVYCGNVTVQWQGGHVFDVSSPENVPGFLVTNSNTVLWTNDVYVTETGPEGAFKFEAAGNSACKIRGHVYSEKAGAKAVTGTPSRSIRFDLTTAGTVEMGSVVGRPALKNLATNPLRSKDPWRPEGTKAENMSRLLGFKNMPALTSGTLFVVGGLILPADEAITAVHFYAGTTGATEPTHQWVCLLDTNRKVLSLGTDKTTEAWAANTKKTFTITSYTPASGEDQPVYVGLLVTATTVPTLRGAEAENSFPGNNGPIIAGNSNTGLTTPSGLTVGGTATALSAQNRMPYCTVN